MKAVLKPEGMEEGSWRKLAEWWCSSTRLRRIGRGRRRGVGLGVEGEDGPASLDEKRAAVVMG